MLFANYSTGTVSVTANGTVVTGSGSVWSGVNARAGDLLQIGSVLSFISDVTDPLHLVIPPFAGSTVSAVAYTIYQTSPLRFAGGQAMADVASLVAVLNGMGTIYAVTGAAPDPSIGTDGQYALKTNTGQWQLWLRVSGAWVLQGAPVGTNFRGPYNNATSYAVADMVTSGGALYISNVASNLNNTPASSPTQWSLAAAAGAQGIPGAIGPTPVISTTSGSAVTVGTGNQTFTVAAGCAFVPGQRLRAVNALLNRLMDGPVASYSGTTLVIAVDDIAGTGTDNTWTISIAGEKGQTGGTGPQGSASTVPGPAGPASTVPGPQGPQGVTGTGIQPDASGTLTQRATYDGQTIGYKFLQTDVAPFRLYVKASNTTGDWAGPTYIGGNFPVGDLGHITDSIVQTFDFGHIV